jgi:hypothetical protein
MSLPDMLDAYLPTPGAKNLITLLLRDKLDRHEAMGNDILAAGLRDTLAWLQSVPVRPA